MDINKECLYEGTNFKVSALTNRGKCQVHDFVNRLSPKEKKKVAALLQRTADHGQIKNKQKSEYIEEGIWEFKASFVRIFYFRDGDDFILTHGVIKKTRRLKDLNTEVDKALRLRAQYLEAKRRGEII